MNLSFSLSCWQLCKYGGAIYVEISSSDVPDAVATSPRPPAAQETRWQATDLESSSSSACGFFTTWKWGPFARRLRKHFVKRPSNGKQSAQSDRNGSHCFLGCAGSSLAASSSSRRTNQCANGLNLFLLFNLMPLLSFIFQSQALGMGEGSDVHLYFIEM